jgi:hypothetical protein
VSESLSKIRIRLFYFIPEPPVERDQEKSALVRRGKKSASITSITLFIPVDHVLLVV